MFLSAGIVLVTSYIHNSCTVANGILWPILWHPTGIAILQSFPVHVLMNDQIADFYGIM